MRVWGWRDLIDESHLSVRVRELEEVVGGCEAGVRQLVRCHVVGVVAERSEQERDMSFGGVAHDLLLVGTFGHHEVGEVVAEH